MEYHSAITKNEIMPSAATWMDLEIIVLSKISQKEKDKYDITYMWMNRGILSYYFCEVANNIYSFSTNQILSLKQHGKYRNKF